MRSLTRRTQSAKDVRRAEAYDAVLSGLQQALSEGATLNGLTVGELASRAGISRSRFYAHFRDKGEFLCAWLDSVRDELVDGWTVWLDLGPFPNEDELRAGLRQVTATYLPHVAMMTALFDAAMYDSAVHDQLRRLTQYNVAALTRHIERGQRQGWVDAEVLPRPTSEWLTWMAERANSQVLCGATEAEIDHQVKAFAYIVWRSLYAPSARDKAPARG